MYYTSFYNTQDPYACRYNIGFPSNNSMDIIKETTANILKQLADNRTDWSLAKKEQYKAYIDMAKRANREDEKSILFFIISTMWCLS